MNSFFAFKEWSMICAALLRGDQALILRKGGIAEGKKGFAFEHPEFFLFPTHYHEQLAATRFPEGTPVPEPTPGHIVIEGRACVVRQERVTDWERVRALQPLHFWKEEVIRQRFDYDDAGAIHVALVRVFRLPVPWVLEDRPAFGGCRSWISMPDPAGVAFGSPVLDDGAFAAVAARLDAVLGPSSAA